MVIIIVQLGRFFNLLWTDYYFIKKFIESKNNPIKGCYTLVFHR